MMKSVFTLCLIHFSFVLSAQFCDGPLGPNLFPEGDFGSGSSNILSIDPGIAPGYTYTTSPPPIDGSYCITNDLNDWNFNWDWYLIQDNSTDPNGYMMVVNASYDPGLFYQQEVDGLCENSTYVFSCDIFNLGEDLAHIKPNVSFLIDGVEEYNTGDIPATGQWVTFGFAFTTGPGQTSVDLALMNNADGGYGNDLAIDNITFSQCGPEAILPNQEDMDYFESYCQGLTIQFDNLSYGTSSYLWDFGDLSTTEDISNLYLPSYTYPSGGTYTVTLIANPGVECSDTTEIEITVYDEIEAFFEAPDPQCVSSNSFNFEGQGTFPVNGVTFEWDFGTDANPTGSNNQSVTNVNFANPGIKEVTYTVFFESCQASYQDEVLVAAPSTINFNVPDDIKCAPYELEFSNYSESSTELFAFWDFGDGNNSSEFHPTHTYTDPGTYDVTLTVWTDAGCIDTLQLIRDNLIVVHPKPTSVFSVDPPEQLIFHPTFEFTNLSPDAVSSIIYFADGNSSSENQIDYVYNNQSGVLLPWQIVYNEFGCSDKSYQQLKIIPVEEVLVPNAFTPNGDDHNNLFQPILFEDQVTELYIYDRWGELIFSANELNASWDGTSNGQLVPDGIYIWRLIYTDFTTEMPTEVEGHIVVLK